MKNYLIHPYIFGLYPLFFLVSNNISQLTYSSKFEIIILLFLIILFVYLLNFLFNLFFKDKEKSYLLSVFFIFLFYLVGHKNGLLPALILFLLFFYFIRKIQKNFKIAHKILTIMALVLIIMPIFSITLHLISYSEKNSLNELNLKSSNYQALKEKKFRDIYYLIMDGYTGSFALKEHLDFDNLNFINFLKSKNFHVAEKSQTNYNFTNFSIPSTLNMQYLSDINLDNYPNNPELIKKVEELMKKNLVKKYLDNYQYKYIMVPSRVSTNWVPDNLDFVWKDSPDNYIAGDFINLFINQTILSTTNLFKKNYLNNRRDEILRQFNFLEEGVHKIQGPKFVFAHILSPHPPYVFKENGELADTDSSDEKWEFPNEYLNQIKFINIRLEEIIEKIIKNSDIEPIIILQGDHGAILFGTEPNKKNIEMSTNILNAILLPEMNKEFLSNKISPVNTFRLIFKKYFNIEINLLKDKVFYYDAFSISKNKKLIEINKEILKDSKILEN